MKIESKEDTKLRLLPTFAKGKTVRIFTDAVTSDAYAEGVLTFDAKDSQTLMLDNQVFPIGAKIYSVIELLGDDKKKKWLDVRGEREGVQASSRLFFVEYYSSDGLLAKYWVEMPQV